MPILTLDIPEEMDARIREICEQRGCSVEEAVRDLLRRYIAVEQLRQLRKMTAPLVEAQGFITDEDIFKSTS